MSGFRIRKMFVDTGNSVDVLFWDAFQRMGIRKDRFRLVGASLVRLARHRFTPLGTIHLTLTFRAKPWCTRVDANWLVANYAMSYNAIIGHPSLIEVMAAISRYQLLKKFLTDRGIAKVRGDQIAAKKGCFSSLHSWMLHGWMWPKRNCKRLGWSLSRPWKKWWCKVSQGEWLKSDPSC